MLPKGLVLTLLSFILLASLSYIIHAYAGAYSTTSPVICAENCSSGTLNGGFELYNNTWQYCDSNPIECYNTIDNCKDGALPINTIMQGSPYEWVENITITSSNGNNFTGGETAEILAFVRCDYDGDYVTFSYNNGSGWKSIYNYYCQTYGFVDINHTFTLDDIIGTHTLRVVIAYDGDIDMLCSDDWDQEYSDTDDVSFFVYSQYETTPPSVSNIKPSQNSTYEFILPKTFKIQADVTDNLQVGTVIANISWGANMESVELTNTVGDTWSGGFASANITGRYNITIIANDTNGNLNSSETSYFFFSKTSNITLSSPRNEKWYANYTVLLDYVINASSQVLWSAYKLSSNSLVNVTSLVSHKNNVSAVNTTFVNNTETLNISQSFNLTENMTIGEVRLKLKRIGPSQNLTLQIRNDSGGVPGTILASTNISSQISNTTFSWANFTFNTTVSLDVNKKYWLLITPNGTAGNYTHFEANNGTYSGGELLSDNSLDLLFEIYDGYHYRQNISLPGEGQNITAYNITVYSNVSGNSQLFLSPTVEFYVDRLGPSFLNMQYTPSQQADIDPEVIINVTVEISDEFNVSSAILQYKLSNASAWSNLTMSNTSSTYYANFTPASEGNWSIRVFAIDTLSNDNFSSEQNISVLYEKTYEVNTSSFNSTASVFLGTNASMGEIGISNTGDLNLTFTVNKTIVTYPAPVVLFNNLTFMNVTIWPGNTTWINVTVTGNDDEGTSDFRINIIPQDEAALNSTQINATLVSFVSGPYFLVKITQYDPSVTQGESRVVLSAEIQNMGNETAGNVTVYWTLPSGWSAKENTSVNISSIAVKQNYTLSITGVVGASAPTGTKQIVITAQNSLTNNSDSRSVIVNSKSPSTPPSGWGSDTTTTVTSIVEVGKPEIIIYAPDAVEVMRGEKAIFSVNITNKEEKELTNISLSLGGFMLSYTSITPEYILILNKSGSVEAVVVLDVPLYLGEGKYPLTFGASFPWSGETLTFEKEITLVILSTNASDFSACILEAEKKVLELKEDGYNTGILEELVLKSRELLLSKDYEMSRQACEEVILLVDDAKEAKAMIESIKEAGGSDEGYSGSVSDALSLAMDAFERGEFDAAKSRAKDASLLLEIEKNKFIYQVKKMIRSMIENWPFSLLAIVVVGLLGFMAYSNLSIGYVNKKIRALKEEESSILELIGGVQRHRFKERAISQRIYEKHMNIYRERLAKIQEEKNESLLKFLSLKGASKKQSITSQMELLMQFKKDLQEEFYVKRIIDKKSYHGMSAEYNHLFSKLEEQLEMMGSDKNEKQK